MDELIMNETFSSAGLWVRAAAALVLAYFQGLPVLFQVLVVLMALDVLSGLIVARKKQELSSDKNWHGLAKKAATLIIVGMCYLVDYASVAEAGQQLPLSIGTASAGFFCLQEGLSITENAALAGVKIPAFIREGLELLAPNREMGKS